jgi:hypothetical protein
VADYKALQRGWYACGWMDRLGHTGIRTVIVYHKLAAFNADNTLARRRDRSLQPQPHHTHARAYTHTPLLASDMHACTPPNCRERVCVCEGVYV